MSSVFSVSSIYYTLLRTEQIILVVLRHPTRQLSCHFFSILELLPACNYYKNYCFKTDYHIMNKIIVLKYLEPKYFRFCLSDFQRTQYAVLAELKLVVTGGMNTKIIALLLIDSGSVNIYIFSRLSSRVMNYLIYNLIVLSLSNLFCLLNSKNYLSNLNQCIIF